MFGKIAIAVAAIDFQVNSEFFPLFLRYISAILDPILSSIFVQKTACVDTKISHLDLHPKNRRKNSEKIAGK